MVSSDIFGCPMNGMCTVLFFIALSLKSLLSLSSSPPSKAEAFEDFKLGQGSKINHIFKENKAVLLERRSLLQQLTEEVNMIKREIDCITAFIQQRQETRRGQGTLNVDIIKTILRKVVDALICALLFSMDPCLFSCQACHTPKEDEYKLVRDYQFSCFHFLTGK